MIYGGLVNCYFKYKWVIGYHLFQGNILKYLRNKQLMYYTHSRLWSTRVPSFVQTHAAVKSWNVTNRRANRHIEKLSRINMEYENIDIVIVYYKPNYKCHISLLRQNGVNQHKSSHIDLRLTSYENRKTFQLVKLPRFLSTVSWGVTTLFHRHRSTQTVDSWRSYFHFPSIGYTSLT